MPGMCSPSSPTSRSWTVRQLSKALLNLDSPEGVSLTCQQGGSCGENKVLVGMLLGATGMGPGARPDEDQPY